jgi:hypothetical protein
MRYAESFKFIYFHWYFLGQAFGCELCGSLFREFAFPNFWSFLEFLEKQIEIMNESKKFNKAISKHRYFPNFPQKSQISKQ